MDRYQGAEVFSAEEMAEAAALEAAAHQLTLERREWEGDRDAVAEYESWFLNKTIMEATAETQGVLNG